MKKNVLTLLFLTLPIFASAAWAEELANVNGVSITTEDFKKSVEQIPPQMKAQLSNPEEKKRLLERLVDMELLSQEARKSGIDKDPLYNNEVELAKKEILVNLMVQKMNREKVTDEAVRSYYAKHLKDFQLIHSSHILVKTEEDAIKIKKELSAGGDFSELAKKYSTDPGSAQKGGDLGFMSRRQLVPEFADLAFKLKPNEMGGPVKSQFGYHLIKVLEVKSPKFEELTQENVRTIRSAIISDEIERLKKNGKVTINPDALKTAN